MRAVWFDYGILVKIILCPLDTHCVPRVFILLYNRDKNKRAGLWLLMSHKGSRLKGKRKTTPHKSDPIILN